MNKFDNALSRGLSLLSLALVICGALIGTDILPLMSERAMQALHYTSLAVLFALYARQ